jgi:hypothetical protein
VHQDDANPLGSLERGSRIGPSARVIIQTADPDAIMRRGKTHAPVRQELDPRGAELSLDMPMVHPQIVVPQNGVTPERSRDGAEHLCQGIDVPCVQADEVAAKQKHVRRRLTEGGTRVREHVRMGSRSRMKVGRKGHAQRRTGPVVQMQREFPDGHVGAAPQGSRQTRRPTTRRREELYALPDAPWEGVVPDPIGNGCQAGSSEGMGRPTLESDGPPGGHRLDVRYPERLRGTNPAYGAPETLELSLLDTAKMRYPVTPDGRYFVVRGRLWRCTDPGLNPDEREQLTRELMRARAAVGRAKRAGDEEGVRLARTAVDSAKVALGERGAVWWTDGAPDYNRHLAKNTPYREWFASLPGK